MATVFSSLPLLILSCTGIQFEDSEANGDNHQRPDDILESSDTGSVPGESGSRGGVFLHIGHTLNNPGGAGSGGGASEDLSDKILEIFISPSMTLPIEIANVHVVDDYTLKLEYNGLSSTENSIEQTFHVKFFSDSTQLVNCSSDLVSMDLRTRPLEYECETNDSQGTKLSMNLIAQ